MFFLSNAGEFLSSFKRFTVDQEEWNNLQVKAPRRIHRIRSIHKLVICLVMAVLGSLALSRIHMEGTTRIMIAWDIFSLCMLVFAAIIWLTIHSRQIRIVASHEDPSRTAVFFLVVMATVGSLLGILLLLGNKSGWMLSKGMETFIYIAGVTLSWLLLHTTFTYRYAHLYYGDRGSGSKEFAGGLDIPGEKFPDYLDFAYFSFVIGMTFQVSDIQISSRRIRRLALVHGMLSFLFNTVIVALTINVVVDFKS